MFIRLKQLRNILALSCLVALPFSALAASSHVQVTVDKLNVRSGPSLQDKIITTLPVNAILPVVSETQDWVQVKLPNGSTGWLANWLVKPVTSASSQKQAESQVSNLNVRSGPSQTFPVIYTINPGTKYPLLQKSGQWLQIQLPNSQKGWIASWLAKEVEGRASAPSQTTPLPGPAPEQPISAPNAGAGQQGDNLTLTYAPYVYPEPDETLPAIAQLSAGQSVKKIGQADGWIQIDYMGAEVWIPASPSAKPPADVGTLSDGSSAPDGGPESGNSDAPAASATTATVSGDGVNLRSQPNTSSGIITTLARGTALDVLGQQGDWYQVKTAAGQAGWIAGWLVDVEKPQAPVNAQPSVSILNPDTNVRSGPGTRYEIIGRVQTGERYPIVKQEDQWFQIKLNDGTTGFVAGWLVSADGVPNVVKGNELVNKVIVVDPGHGGNDNGATGSSFSTLEKTINLQVSLLLKNKLEAAGAKVIMTRSDDRKLTLQQRVDIAVQQNADIFVSIHHNTHPNTLTNGTIVFYYSQGNPSKLASLVQNEVVKATNYKNLQARYGNYFVLRENPVVSILAEIGFLSNYNEEIRLRSSKQQELAAEGIYKGILQYFASMAE